MKRLIYLFLVIIIGVNLISCEKQDAEPQLRELPGSWQWTATCGGFTGACSYPDEENYKSLEINDARYIEWTNGSITIDMEYVIIDTLISESNYPYEVAYELSLEDGSRLDITLFKELNKLAIGNDPFLDYYEGK